MQCWICWWSVILWISYTRNCIIAITCEKLDEKFEKIFLKDTCTSECRIINNILFLIKQSTGLNFSNIWINFSVKLWILGLAKQFANPFTSMRQWVKSRYNMLRDIKYRNNKSSFVGYRKFLIPWLDILDGNILNCWWINNFSLLILSGFPFRNSQSPLNLLLRNSIMTIVTKILYGSVMIKL